MNEEEMAKKILVFGKVAKDYIVTDFPFSDFHEKIKREETNTVGKIAEYWGGSGLNVAAASSFPCFSKAVDTYLFTQNARSGDPDRDALNQLCKNLGIKLVPLEESYIPKICVLVESGKEKSRTFLSGSNGKMSLNIDRLQAPEKEKIFELAKDAHAVVLAGLTPDNPFASIDMRILLNEMKRRNPDLIVALDLIASDFGESQLSIFSSADYLLPSDAELPLLLEDVAQKVALKKELEKPLASQNIQLFDAAATHIFKRFQSLKLLGVKRGRAGSRVYQKTVEKNPALRVWWRESISEERDVKDTTGAGDSWIGAFMASEAMNSNPGESAAGGNVIARLCISELGAINWRSKDLDSSKFHELVKLVPGDQGIVR
jgi:sugar/nucleoside kinase (ribokinase family)